MTSKPNATTAVKFSARFRVIDGRIRFARLDSFLNDGTVAVAVAGKPAKLDRVVKNGVTTFFKLNTGDLVSYTSKAGNTATYEVIQVIRDEIMYGVYRGSKILKVELRRPGCTRSFVVNRSAVKIQ